MKRVVALVFAVFVTAGLSQRAALAAEHHPNILFLVCDEYRHDCLGVEGHPIVKTPNFDKLANDGVRLRQAYVAAPVCSPSRATLFTGRYPQVHGVTTNNMAFAPGEVVLPELLRKQGYTTGIVGKLHLQDHAAWFDYDQIDTEGSSAEYRAFLAAKGKSIKGSANSAAVEGSLFKKDQTPLRVGTSVLPEELFPETWEADQAINFIHQQKGKDKPFFLYVSMLKPHSEFVVPAPFDKIYPGKELLAPASFQPNIKLPSNFTTNSDDDGGKANAKDEGAPADKDAKTAGKGAKDGKRAARREGGPGSPERTFISDPDILKEATGHYYGAVTMVDKQMGRVLAAIDESGLRDDTIVVFTSDHGNMLGEHNRMFKGVMYESSARVPMLYRGPGIKAGKVSEEVLDNSTVMPTLLDLAGFAIPKGVQGQSIAPLLRGDAPGPGVAYSYLSDKMVRKGDWKLIIPLNHSRGGPELYNVVKDPNEQNNQYGKPEAAGVQKELTDLMNAWIAQKPPKVEMPKPS
jgi:arylsulfatase A-like enzyme